MKNFKSFISTMLVACMAMSMTAGAVGAENEGEVERLKLIDGIEINGDMSYEEGALHYVPTKEDELRRSLIDAMPSPLSTIYYKVLNVTAFLQDNNHYCGPATVKQTLHYLNGSSSTQATYASKLKTTTAGTDMTLIPGVINNQQAVHTYTYSKFESMDQWLNYGKSALNSNAPAIMDIDTRNVSAFPYSTSGHFVNLSGINLDTMDGSGGNMALVTDPYAPGFGNNWYYITNVYSANHNHFRSAIIH